jgi:hypothetical protein
MQKNGTTPRGKQKYKCPSCGYNIEVAKEYTTELLQIEPEPSKSLGLSEEQLRAKHDIRFIVASKLKELKPGTYLTRSEFIQFCGIRPGQGYSDVLEHPNYDSYHGKAGGVIYFSHPDSIKKLKSEGVLT